MSNPTTGPVKESGRRKVMVPLAVGIALLFGILLSQSSFDLPAFLNPDTNRELLFFAAITVVISALFAMMTFVLARNLLKLLAERRLGVLGSKFRTRVVITGLLLSVLPVIVMFWFAYGFMNRSIDKWFSRPVEEVREDTAAMASLITTYAQQNAVSEAVSIASATETQRGFADRTFGLVTNELQRHETTLQGGFALALLDGNEVAEFRAPAAWRLLQPHIPFEQVSGSTPVPFTWDQTDYILGNARVGESGWILVGMPLPQRFSQTVRQLEASQKRYFELYRQRRLL